MRWPFFRDFIVRRRLLGRWQASELLELVGPDLRRRGCRRPSRPSRPRLAGPALLCPAPISLASDGFLGARKNWTLDGPLFIARVALHLSRMGYEIFIQVLGDFPVPICPVIRFVVLITQRNVTEVAAAKHLTV